MKLSSTRLIEHLEQQIKDEREMHLSVEKRLGYLHSEEKTRILAENKRLSDECERLRLALGQPSRAAEPPEEPKAPVDPDAMPAFSGLPFERAVQKDIWLRSDDGKRWMAKQLGSVKPIESGESKNSKEN